LQNFLFRDHFAKTMTALGILAFITLAMILVPSELKMRVNGVIQPELRKNIFAQTEGIVQTMHVDQGQRVEAGQTLIELANPELEMAISEVSGQLGVVKQRIRETARQLSRIAELPEADSIALMGRKGQLQEQKLNLETRLALMQKKQSRQSIVSPIGGTVVTWDAKNRLEDLPVSTNQFVLAIADFEGPWVAELRIPQNQVGYVTDAMNKAKENGEKLFVEFRIATNPNIEFQGELIRLANRTDPGESGVPEFKAIVQADVSELKDLRPGAGLTAKIHCGKRSTAFVSFYQIIDFLRTRVFF
jgi:multidrug efflux pump subunit AcrA (membrane-fusion protein)